MKNILFLICVLSFFSAGLASAACAHIYDSSSLSLDQQVEISINQDSSDGDNNGLSDPLCDMHCHIHISSIDIEQGSVPDIKSVDLIVSSDDIVTFPIFGLKRPPKI